MNFLSNIHSFLLLYYLRKSHFQPLRSMELAFVLSAITFLMIFVFILFSRFQHMSIGYSPYCILFSSLAYLLLSFYYETKAENLLKENSYDSLVEVILIKIEKKKLDHITSSKNISNTSVKTSKTKKI
jgi:hypothetical protein